MSTNTLAAESTRLRHQGQVRESAASSDSAFNKRQADEQAQRSYFSCHSGLLRHEELPRWIQVIDSTPGWVEKYHRPPQPSVTACLASVVQWNTETVNIWSHLLAFLGSVYFLYDLLTHQFFMGTQTFGFTIDELTWTDQVVLLSFAWSSLALFGISTIFHTFICHSYPVADTLRRLDHVAAINHVACAMYPMVYSALTCSPYRWPYMYAIAISSILCMLVFYFGDIYEPEKAWIRGALALLVAAISIWALVHHGMTVGSDEMWKAIGGGWLFRMMLCNMSALIFYTVHFPECCWPGKFDLVGHSHQLLHIVTAIATGCQAYAILTAYGYNLHTPCVV